MMIALTYRCNMGCTHCISDCKPDGMDMSKDTLIDSLDFIS
jgi:MoaA/NifB/PqqE/SkfB family radical SAM enzyme